MSQIFDMTEMFYKATSFNQDIATWDVGKVFWMNAMFFDATSFNQNLSSWKKTPGRQCIKFAVDSDCPEASQVDATQTCSLPD